MPKSAAFRNYLNADLRFKGNFHLSQYFFYKGKLYVIYVY
jgi:hypothetical protein